MNSSATQLSISLPSAVTELSLVGYGHSSYVFNKPLLFILFSNNSLKLATLDNTYSSTPFSSGVLNFAINAQ